MILPVLALLAAAPQMQTGDLTQEFATWTIHQHDQRAPVPLVMLGRRVVSIETRGPGRAGISKTFYLAPGSLWRVSAHTSGAALIDTETPSGTFGSSTGGDLLFRAPSPGEVAIHLDSTGGQASFVDLRFEPVPEPDPGELRIHLQPTGKRPIDAKQQGQFIEMLCRLIPSMIAQQVDNDSFEEEPPYRFSYIKETDHPYRPWYPDGAVQTAEYALDTQDPFNGRRSQRIEIHVPRARAGIAQDGFYTQAGMRYRLRLHMKGIGTVPVRAVLRDAQGNVAPPVALGRAAAQWQPAEAVLAATRRSDHATLAIDFEGPGTLWLDRVYLIGADAIEGVWRPDVVDAIKALKPGVIRFGGTSIEGLEWDRTIGDWDARAPFTTYWGGLEPNFVGLDEFTQLCRAVGAEPLICVRWTGKQPADAAAEVEYMNGGSQTRWGGLRARNGHPQPYAVKYWQIGNEVGGQDYERSIAAFARAMRAADPSIKLMSSYPRQGVLAGAEGQLDYLCPHHYEMGDLTEVVREFESLRERIRLQGQGREVRIAVTEWNTTGGDFGLKRGILQSLGNALDCSRYHNLLQRYADLVEMGIRSNLIDSFGSGIIVTGPGWMYRAPTYYAEQLYARAAGSYPLHLERTGGLPWQLQQPDVSAALSDDGRMLRIYAVNSTAAPLRPTIVLADAGKSVAGATAFVLKNRVGLPNTEAMNSASDPAAVEVESGGTPVAGGRLEFSFAPYSLTLLEIRL
ncbi:MAG: alpha-L-arabinofuranosidase C-terminal domain-containing protein [Bryobacteraceae bacterium]